MIVGKDIPIRDIVSVLASSPGYALLRLKLFELAMELELPVSLVSRIRHDMLIDRTDVSAAIYEMLTLWSEMCGSRATLKKLIKTFKHSELLQLANKLESFEKSDLVSADIPGVSKPLQEINIIIGEKESTISKVIAILSTATTSGQVFDKMQEIGKDLNVEIETLQKIKMDLLLCKISNGEALYYILESWVTNAGKNATLNTLLKVLRDNKLIIYAEHLQNAFGKKDDFSEDRHSLNADYSNKANEQTEMILGSQDCQIKHIVLRLERSPEFELLVSRWSDLALALEIPSHHLQKIRGDLQLNLMSIHDVYIKLIEEWASRNGSMATLNKLSMLFESSGFRETGKFIMGEPLLKSEGPLVPSIKMFLRLPKNLESFLKTKDTNKTVLILYTIDANATCDKIRAVSICTCLDSEELTRLLSMSELSSQFNEHLIVVKCNNVHFKTDELKRLKFRQMILITTNYEWIEKDKWIEQCNDTFEFQDLSTRYKLHVRKYFERQNISVSREVLNALNGRLLLDALADKKITLFKDMLPEELAYYIPRTITTRNIIRSDIFHDLTNDIFLFKGYDKHELSRILKRQIIRFSTTAIDHSSQFIILEISDHYDKILEREYPKKSVHLFVKGENGRIKWESTMGNINIVQRNVESSQVECNEEDFINQILNQTSTRTVLISDLPGMGKSNLLYQIARKLIKKQQDKILMLFNFVDLLQEIKKYKDISATAFISALQTLGCNNEVGNAVLKSGLLSADLEIVMELLLDGFDEITMQDEIVAYEILKLITSSFSSIRMWITTRANMLEKLETFLNILGHRIRPFNRQDQIRYLANFWSRSSGEVTKIKNKRIEKFAEKCLDNIKEEGAFGEDNSFACIPLQCLLIGEVYEEDAIYYANGVHDVIMYETGSITELYKRFTQRKIQKLEHCHPHLIKYDEVINGHILLAIRSLFPHQHSNLQSLLTNSSATMEVIMKAGIVEHPKFFHRSFAEFFIALFLSRQFQSNALLEQDFLKFVFQNVLETKANGNFIHKPICCFLERLLSKNEIACTFSGNVEVEKIEKVAIACIDADFFKILQMIQQICHARNITTSVFTEKLLLEAIQKSTLQIIVLVMTHVENHTKIGSELKSKLLATALQRGTYSIVEFLLKDKSLHSSTKMETSAGLKTFMHHCVQFSVNNSNEQIENKLRSVTLLSNLNQALLEELDEEERTCLVSEDIHVRLIITLINLGANPFSKDKNGNTFLHLLFKKSGETPTAYRHEDYEYILQNIKSNILHRLLHTKNKSGETPLISIFSSFDPSPIIFECLRKANIDWNELSSSGDSILALALKSQRNRNSIKSLVDYGAALDWKGQKGESLLHVAAATANVFVLQLLLKQKEELDDDGLSPLDYAICNGRDNKVLNSLKHFGFKEIVNSQEQTWLHIAASQGLVESIRFLLNCGRDLKTFDSFGNTPLHLLFTSRENLFVCAKLLIDFGKYNNIVNKLGDKPIQSALKSSHLDWKTFQLLETSTNIEWSASFSTLVIKYIISSCKTLDDLEFSEYLKKCKETGANFGIRDKHEDTLLHIAVDKMDLRSVKYLVDNGVDLNAKNKWLTTPLHMASLEGDTDEGIQIVQLLISNGADVLAIDNEGATFLHKLLQYCNPSPSQFHSLVKVILSMNLGQIFNTLNTISGRTPFHEAVFKIDIEGESLKMLYKSGVDFNQIDRLGNSALILAIHGNRSLNLVSLLIQLGANHRHTNFSRSDLLQISTKHGSLPAMNFFLKLGLNVNGMDVEGNTPLHFAALQRDEKKMRLLVENGGDPNLRNSVNQTPLSIVLDVEDEAERKILWKVLIDRADWSIPQVWTVLTCSYIIKEKWSDFARYLRIPYEDIERLRLELLLDKINRNEILKKILYIWVADQGNNAKLGELIRVVEDECGDNSAAEKLRLTNNLPWKNIHNISTSWMAFQEDADKMLTKFSPQIPNGTEYCSLNDVWAVLSKSYFLKEKWSDFAGFLRIPIEDIEKLRQGLLFNKIGLNYLLMQVLVLWVGHQAGNAQLTELIRVIEDECGDNSVGEKLRLLYNLPCKNFQKHPTNWATLSSALRDKVEQSFSKFFPNILIDTVKTALEGELLLDLMTCKKPKLFKSIIPPSPMFYLKRTLLPRHTISKKVFDADSPDIFIFNGASEFELGKLVKRHKTSTSGEVLDSSKIHVRFIVLEQKSHFQEICKKVSKPVHLLSCDSNCEKFTWIQTSGGINLLQRFVDECESQLTEEEFLESLRNESFGPILISDSPGMGKSFLLSNIAMELGKTDDKIVILTNVNDFIKQVKRCCEHDKTILDSVKGTLQGLICHNELAKVEFSLMLSATVIKFELLMDGFDEVSLADEAQALHVIKVINSFKSIRLWITTRPHYLGELEAELSVLGYNIKVLGENDQVNFLISHWQNSKAAQKASNIDTLKLKEYAIRVLQNIKSKLNKDDNDIAGIPLQCFLISETFEMDCIGFASGKSNLVPSIRVCSISDLYENMITKKFKKYIANHGTNEHVGFDNLIYAHVELSIKLLFPEYKPELNYSQASIQDLLKIGIIQSTSTTGGEEFIHRTFADYFVAGYVIEQLFAEEVQTREFASFLVEQVLMRKKYFLQILPGMDGITSHKFVHHVIGYFINANLSLMNTAPSPPHKYIDQVMNLKTREEIYHACANNGLLKIFQLFFNKEHSSLDKITILLAIRNSTFEYVAYMVSYIRESISAFEEDDLSIFFRAAVQRSEPNIVKLFLRSWAFDFRELIENTNESTKLLLHDCVSNTKYKLEDDIEKRVGVIQLLVEINPDLLEMRDICGRTPLHCEYVHINLLKELIRLGADINSTDMMGNTVLHLSKNRSRQFTAHEYYSLLRTIPKVNLVQIINSAANDEETPLARLLYFIDPTKETLAIFNQEQTDIDDVAFKVAISSGRNSQTLENLIKWGVDISWKGNKGESYLHLASWYGNCNALKLFIEAHNFSANMEDNHLHTPMDYVITSKENKARFETAKILYTYGGRVGEQEEHLLHKAIKDGNVQSVRIILEILKPGNRHLVQQEISRVPEGQTLHLSEERLKLLVRDFVGNNKSTYKDPDGKTLLHLAVLRGDELATKELVENGADLNSSDLYGSTPLHSVCACTDINTRLRVIKFLIDNGANACAKDGDSHTFVSLILRGSKLTPINPFHFHEIAEYLARRNLANLLFSFPNGPDAIFPLHLACQLLELEEKTITLLKENGISFNQLDGNGKNVLVYSIFGGRSKAFINLLVNKCNANWRQRDKRGYTCLHYAVKCGDLEATNFFIDLGLDVNQVDEFGNTPLHCLAKFGEKNISETLKILIEAGADINKQDFQECTAPELILSRKLYDQFNHKIGAELVEVLKIGGIDIESRVPNAPGEALMIPAILANSDEQNKEPLLHQAVNGTINTSDCLNIIKYLIPTETDVYAKNQNGDTFLHKFVSLYKSPLDFHEITKYLLDIGYKDLFETPGGALGVYVLQLSVLNMETKEETLQLLKSREINFNTLDAEGNSLLVYAIRGKRGSKFLALLIDEFDVTWRRLNNSKENLLHIAAENGNEGTLKLFVNLGLDINAIDLRGRTPVHHLSRFGRNNIPTILQLLVDNGADINAKCIDGKTPLHVAATRQDSEIAIEVIECLVKNGADINTIDSKGNTPLYFAINHSRQNLSLISYLIDNGANVHSLNFHQTSYLHLAAGVGGVTVLKFFLDMKVFDVNAVDADNDTSLHCAVQQKQSKYALEKVQILLENGADVNIINNEGQTVLNIIEGREDWSDDLKLRVKNLLKLL